MNSLKCITSASTAFCCGRYNFIAATPDGLISCDCCGSKIVKIKCPFVIKDDDPDLACFLENGCLPKTINITIRYKHSYLLLVQSLQTLWCVDFQTYSNIINEKSRNLLMNAQNKLTSSSGYLPDLLGRWYSRSLIIPV